MSSLKYTRIQSNRRRVKIKSNHRNKFCEVIENAVSGLVVMCKQDLHYKDQHKVVTSALDAMKKELKKHGIEIPDLQTN